MSAASLRNWELNRRAPALRFLPGIIRFLGYVPFPLGESLPERLRAYRKTGGLSQTTLARTLGIDGGTLRRWEPGERWPERENACRVQSLLAGAEQNEG